MSARPITYAQAINEALQQAMELSPDVVVMGQLVDYKSGVFGTTTGLVERFGAERVRDFPVSENLMTAAALGASLTGLRPVIVHQRLDFMIYSLDAIVNWLDLWRFKSNGQSGVPVTIRAIVGKGWGQGPQHSKNLQAWFAHLPGLRVAVPATAYDAKGLLLDSIFSENPAVFIEGRSLFSMTADVPQQPYRIRFGEAAVLRKGRDVTVVALGNQVPLAVRVATELAGSGVEAEVIDLRTLSPWDQTTVCESVERTGRLVVADPAWRAFGAAAEVIATVAENCAGKLRAAPRRVTLPDSHTPMSSALEEVYYPNEKTMADAIAAVMRS
jgi:pyruvate dehydrogenase E1 component beta subunit